MSNSYAGGGFGSRGFGSGHLGSGQHLTEAIDQLRSMFEQRVGPRVARDVRAVILALLAEKPMHGSQIIAEIEQRSGGSWKPNAGSVYPTLQLLADEGLIESEVTDGRKTYSLTESGKTEADAAGGRGAPWAASGQHDHLGVGPLPKSGVALAQAATQLKRTGTPEQVEQGVAVLDEARRKLYAILAQD